jgi:hypothetical protein
MDHNLE